MLRRSHLAAGLLAALSIAPIEAEAAADLPPVCELAGEMAEGIMASRMAGRSFEEMEEAVYELDQREARWMALMLLYDAYYGEPDLLDPEDIGTSDPVRLATGPRVFRVLWEMDCSGQLP